MSAHPSPRDRFSDNVVRAIENRDPFLTAVEMARQGFRVLPVNTIDVDGHCSCGNLNCKTPGKHPHYPTAPRGVLDASSDVDETRDRFALYHPLNVGWALGDGIVALDLDPRAGVDLTQDYGLGATNTEITGGNGEHRFYREPPGRTLRSARLPSGPELKAHGSYVVIAPGRHASGGKYINSAPGRRFQTIPGDWEFLRDVSVATKTLRYVQSASDPRPRHYEAAHRIWAEMLAGPYTTNLLLLREGDWFAVVDDDGKPRYASQSEADASLLFAAAWLERDPRVLDAVLRLSGLDRPKWRERADYRAFQIAYALEGRDRQRNDRQTTIANAAQMTSRDNVCSENSALFISYPLGPMRCQTLCTAAPDKEDVLVGTDPIQNARHRTRNRIVSCVIEFARNAPEEYVRPLGWTRLPVEDLADLHHVNRKTVQRAIEWAAKAELLKTDHRVVKINGQTRRD